MLTYSTSLRAQSSGGPARAVAEQAQQAYGRGQKQEAIEGFKRAYEMGGEANLLFRLGQVSQEIGQNAVAARFYRAYVARDPKGQYRAEAEKLARSLEQGPEKGPAKAPQAQAPAPAKAPLSPAKAPPAQLQPPPFARTSPAPVAAAPAAKLAPPAPVSSPAPADRPAGVELRVEASPPADPSPEPPLPRWLPWAGLGASAALAVGAVVTGLAASSRYDELRRTCGQTEQGCPTADIDDVKSRTLTANLLGAAAGVTALATGVAVYFNTREAGLSGLWRF